MCTPGNIWSMPPSGSFDTLEVRLSKLDTIKSKCITSMHLTGLLSPVTSSDAVNKNYVDTRSINLYGQNGITITPSTIFLGGSATISFNSNGPTFNNIFKTISYTTVSILPYTLSAKELLNSYIIISVNGTGNLVLPSVASIVNYIGYYETNMSFNFSVLKNGSNHVHLITGPDITSPVTINMLINADNISNLILILNTSTTGILLPLGSNHTV